MIFVITKCRKWAQEITIEVILCKYSRQFVSNSPAAARSQLGGNVLFRLAACPPSCQSRCKRRPRARHQQRIPTYGGLVGGGVHVMPYGAICLAL